MYSNEFTFFYKKFYPINHFINLIFLWLNLYDDGGDELFIFLIFLVSSYGDDGVFLIFSKIIYDCEILVSYEWFYDDDDFRF